MAVIDLRSDTVTKPSAGMRLAMEQAELGDDVYGEDPTANRLEEKAATLLEKEAAIFASSGTQTNLIALLCHCERGDEYIAGQQAHTYKYEGGGAAVFGSIQPQPLPFCADGTLDLEQIAEHIKPDHDFHFAKTRLLCLENTCAGKALPLNYLSQTRQFCDHHGLSLHLDGARIFNAAVDQRVDVGKISQYFDSISVCLSKGLGAPVGSVLVGSEKLIGKARRWRKVLGGGMRQVGGLAAAAIYALDNHIQRLQIDHENATLLATGLESLHGIHLLSPAQTNMVHCQVPDNLYPQFLTAMKEQHILLPTDGALMRLVTHLDIGRADISRVIAAFKAYFSDHSQGTKP